MDGSVIRPMTEGDIPEIYGIECASFSVPWKINDFYVSISPDFSCYHSLLLEKDGQICGFIIYSAVCGEGEILDIATASGHRREGIAGCLLKEAADDMLKSGVGQIYLEVRESNVPARNLYEKLGFREYGIRKGYYKMPDEDAVLMTLKI